MFEKHNNDIEKLENIQNQNLEKQIKDFEDTKTSIKDTSSHIMNHISETSTRWYDTCLWLAISGNAGLILVIVLTYHIKLLASESSDWLTMIILTSHWFTASTT